jgi:hypothetical protein
LPIPIFWRKICLGDRRGLPNTALESGGLMNTQTTFARVLAGERAD